MTIQLSSLNNLYNNGIIDYVPYDVLPQAPMQQMGMGYVGQYGQYGQLVQQYGNPNMSQYNQQYASPYMQQAQQGNLYNTYTSDSFVRQNLAPQANQYSFMKNAYGVEPNANNKSFRQTILDEANSTNNDVTSKKVSNKSGFIKGLIAGGIMIGTLVCILKGKKP